MNKVNYFAEKRYLNRDNFNRDDILILDAECPHCKQPTKYMAYKDNSTDARVAFCRECGAEVVVRVDLLIEKKYKVKIKRVIK